MTKTPTPPLSPKEFKDEMTARLWTYKTLAARWNVSSNWLRKLVNNPQRPTHWDDSVLGLPLADTDVLTTEHIRAAKAQLRSLPPAPARKHAITARDAIRLLAKDIQMLQVRGYTIKQIADHLNTLGFSISATSLSSFLSRAKKNGTDPLPDPTELPAGEATPTSN